MIVSKGVVDTQTSSLHKKAFYMAFEKSTNLLWSISYDDMLILKKLSLSQLEVRMFFMVGLIKLERLISQIRVYRLVYGDRL